mmetsp:Transcript_16163/g.37851  ORF Transcript_16163/g.37851 Transcript_16163/m.37851 type:complete len:606 (-) Transcript_16163:63-1880(-)
MRLAFSVVAYLCSVRSARVELDEELSVASLEPRALEERSSVRLEPSAQERGFLSHLEVKVEGHRSGHKRIPFPEKLKSQYGALRYLGAGSFGESWLVKNNVATSAQYGSEVVMKLLYLKESETRRHLTWRMVQEDDFLARDAREAEHECTVTANMPRKDRPGSAHVVRCHGTNIPRKGESVSVEMLDEPLFLVLEYCGDESLTQFMFNMAQQNQLQVQLVQILFKQILQGLDFLASFKVPWVHHDLKPDNIVVNRHGGGNYSVHLVDFGGSVRAESRRRCEITPCSADYAPQEYASLDILAGTGGCRQNFYWREWCGARCCTAFDVFSAGAILLELVTGSRLYQFPGILLDDGPRGGPPKYDYSRVTGFAREPKEHAKNFSAGQAFPGTRMAFEKLRASFLANKSDSADFFIKAMKSLQTDPRSRPTARELLNHSFMKSAPNQTIPKPLLVCRFEINEEVEIYNASTHKFDGRGKVTLLAVGNELWVQPLDGKTLLKRPCDDARFRKLSKTQSIHEAGFLRPAAGDDELLDSESLASIHKESQCPEICLECRHLPSLSPRQYVCWSAIRLEDSSTEDLEANDCATTVTHQKDTPSGPFLGYLCSP